jgi:hypothetical protein
MSRAYADGEVSLRGGYYKERATRVVQPMIDVKAEAGENGQFDGHLLVDTITSASIAAGAQGVEFREQRYEFGAGYSHRFSDLTLGGSLRYSHEPDYQSLFASLRGAIDLFQQNTRLGLGVAYGDDDLSNASGQGGLMEPLMGELTTALATASWTQVLSDVLVSELTYDFTFLDGFQENPYRTVAAGGMRAEERVPDLRYRHAVALAARRFWVGLDAVSLASYRFYGDNWGVFGHTPEARWIQRLSSEIFVHGRYRFHWQNRADFYRSIYDSADPSLEPFITDDPKLGAMTTHTIGGKLEVGLSAFGVSGRSGDIRAELQFDYLVQDNRYGNALQAQLGVTVPFVY